MAAAQCPYCQTEVAVLRSFRGSNGELVQECRCPKCGRGGYHTPAKQRRCPRCSHCWAEPVPFRPDVPEAMPLR